MGNDALARTLLGGQFVALGLLALPDSPRSKKVPGRFRKALGWGCIAAGGALSAAGARALGPDLTPLPIPRPGVRLRNEGPYAFTRHPIYAGILLAAIGRSIASGGRRHMIATASLAVILQLKAGFEERLLTDVVDYRSYQVRVPRWVGLRRN